MSVERKEFGAMPDGKSVYEYIISNANETQVHILTLGATLRSFVVEDKNGEKRDVLLGFDTVSDYLEKSDYQGVTVGPVCNRIGGAAFNIGETKYELVANEKGVTTLHSGGEYSFAVWNAIVVDSDAVEFSYISPDGLNGFPGTIDNKVTFKLTEDNKLHITYSAVSDKDTYINLTNHAYFNLNGFAQGDILSHTLQIDADCVTAVDELSIPTGENFAVDGTAFDFRQPKKIGVDIDNNCEQINFTGGFDHNFCINNCDGTLKKCASAKSEESGIVLNVYTTLPGVQFYAGNFLSGIEGKDGKAMNKRSAFCLETQYYPDSPNKPGFPSCFYKAGEEYSSETVYEVNTDI